MGFTGCQFGIYVRDHGMCLHEILKLIAKNIKINDKAIRISKFSKLYSDQDDFLEKYTGQTLELELYDDVKDITECESSLLVDREESKYDAEKRLYTCIISEDASIMMVDSIIFTDGELELKSCHCSAMFTLGSIDYCESDNDVLVKNPIEKLTTMTKYIEILIDSGRLCKMDIKLGMAINCCS